MKHILIFLVLLCIYVESGAQAISLTIDNQNPGWLSSKINYGDQQTTEYLTITGYVNSADLLFIGSLMQKHNLDKSLDLSDAFIVGNTTENDNDISYDNIFGLNTDVNIGKLALPTSITVPNPKANIKPLKYVTVDTLIYGSKNCQIYNNALWGYVYSGGSGAGSSPKHLVLREGITSIAAYACDNYKYNSYGNNVKIETVSCPTSMKFIGNGAFRECDQLTSINLPDSIEEIQELAFEKSSFAPDTLKLPRFLKVYHTNSFPIKKEQVIILGDNIERFDNKSWVLTKNTTATFIINRKTPPTFIKGARYSSYQDSYSDGKELSGCTIYVPKEGYPKYIDPKYDSVGGSGGHWSGWSNPYSHATIKTIPVPVDGITLSHSSEIMNVGNTLNIKAVIHPDNADNKTIIWSSSNNDIASVDNNGLVTAISSGRAFIMATSQQNSKIFASCEIKVHQPLQEISLKPTDIDLKVGESFENMIVTFSPLSSDNKAVIWKSSNETVVKVNAIGKITALCAGEAIVTVESVENPEIKASCIVTVSEPVTGISLNKTTLELKEDDSEKLIAKILPENATNKSVNWSSSDISIAMVAPDGTVYGIKPGRATVMVCTEDGGFAALCKVTVTPATDKILVNEIILNHASISGVENESFEISATVLPENATNKTLEWMSSDNTVATIDNGIICLVKTGTAIITASATDGSGASANCIVIVSDNSGIESIIGDKKSYVKVFDLSGYMIYEGRYSDARLASGFYIVICNQKNYKIWIK